MAPSGTTKTKESSVTASATNKVPMDLLIQKRDALVTSLAQLAHAAQEASWASIEFFNLQFPDAAGHPPAPAFHHMYSGGSRMFAKGAGSPGAKANDDDDDMTIVDGKPVKRKEKLSRAQRKAQRDPNEPKRPVTAYFLFLQHARPQLAKDMPNAKGNELQQEATERWNGMSEDDKRPYRDLYESNYAKFKKEMEEYKAKKEGRPVTAGDDAAGGAGTITVNEQAEQSATESEDEEEATPARPAKVAKTDSTSKSKSNAKSTPKASKAAKKDTTSKRGSKKKAATPEAEEEEEEAEPVVTPKVTPAKKDRKRKR